jgi:hypothetical protein
MKFIIKYSIGLYILVTLMYKLGFIVPMVFTQSIFYGLMGLGVIAMPFYSKVLYSRQSFKTFWIFHFITLLNLIYLLLFNLSNVDSWLYFLTKLSGFNLIMLSLIYNYDFYKEWTTKYFKYIILTVLFLGLIYGSNGVSDVRLSIGFNPNDVGLFGLLGMFSIVALNPRWQTNKIDIALVLLFLIVALLSGSKAALLGVAVVVILNYGISYKSIGLAFVFLLAIYIVGSSGFTTGLDRFASEKSTFETRDEVYRAGLLTFNDALLLGNGLDKYGWSNPKYFPSPELALGPHNAYLATGIMYGLIFGSFFLISIGKFVAKARAVLKFNEQYIKFSYYFLLLVLINGLFETLIVGVNEFITVLFWFFIGVVAMFQSMIKNSKYATSNK